MHWNGEKSMMSDKNSFDDTELKEILIFAIKGKGVTVKVDIMAKIRTGYVVMCGNQWNEDFKWIDAKLKTLTVSELKDLYGSI